MTLPRIICWVSRGVPSAIAAKMILTSGRNHEILPVFCETGSEHPDNDRFAGELEDWFGKKIIRLKNKKYKDTWDVWEQKKFIAGIKGAPCTTALKVEPRLDFQRIDDIHVFGYTADKRDVARAQRLRDNFFELTIETPLIEAGLTRTACLGLAEKAGLTPPLTYDWGLPNANCLPCPKATSPDYWALIRHRCPNEFARMVELSRRLDVRLARIAGVRIFIDEIPDDWPMTQPVAPSCDFLCQLVEQELAT